MKQATFFIFLLLLLSISCKKKSKESETIAETVTLSIDASNSMVLPGDALIVKLDKRITTSEVSIKLGTATVKGNAYGDSAYIFLVPVLAPGAVNLSIPAIERSNTITVTIKNYTPITNAQSIVTSFISKRNSVIDSITKTVSGSNFQPSSESVTLINQLKEEWDTQMSLLSAADREVLAYVLERNMPDPSQSSFTALPPGYFGKMEGQQSDVGDKLVALAKSYVTAQTVCLASIPFLLPSAWAFLAAPNPLTGLTFLAVFTTFVISRETAIRRAKEVGRLRGVAEAIIETNAQRTMTAEFFNNSEKMVTMNVGFRNLRTGDESIQADIANSFNKEQAFATEDKKVETIYNQVKAKTTKLKDVYPIFTGVIGKQAPTNINFPVDGNEIIIKSVSDNRIGFTSILSGSTRRVRITSSSTTDVVFNMVVAYKRKLDNKEITQTIPCLYKANICGNMTAPVITSFKLECNSDGKMVGLISFTANGTGALIKAGSGVCTDATTFCYPVRLYIKNPGATDFIIAWGVYNVILKSGNVNQGVIEIDWYKPCFPGKTGAESLKEWYPNTEWKIELMNQCGQRSAQISF
jgi:hypothetical protein